VAFIAKLAIAIFLTLSQNSFPCTNLSCACAKRACARQGWCKCAESCCCWPPRGVLARRVCCARPERCGNCPRDATASQHTCTWAR
jgi:hypothetical protein